MKPFFPFLLIAATPALAHPGHGTADASHWLSDGAHLAVLGLGSFAIALGLRKLRPMLRKDRRHE